MARINDDGRPLGSVAVKQKAIVLDLLLERFGAAGKVAKLLAGPLEEAASTGDVYLLKSVLKLGASANTTCSDGDSVLHMAANAGSQLAVRALVKHGAVVHAPGRDGRTPLHLAAIKGHALTVASLLAVDAQHVNFRCSEDELRALDLAAYTGGVAAMKTLIRNEADVHGATSKGHAALHAAALGDQAGAIRLLVRNGADINAQDERRRTPLHIAAQNDQVAAIKALLRGGADINAQDINGQTPLHLATKETNVASVRALCELNADKDRRNKSGRTPLHLAITTSRGFSAMVALLDAGADIELRERSDFESSPLDLASWFGDARMVKELLERGANVTADDSKGRTALHTAALYGQVRTIDLLVGAGADVHAPDSVGGGMPFHYAAQTPAIEVARALLGHGASVNAPDENGHSPLHHAACMSENDSSAEMIDHLLTWGADEKAVDSHGRIPVEFLGYAAQLENDLENPPINELALHLLTTAPESRAWRRRRVPVICRSRLDKARRKLADAERAGGASGQACGMMTRGRKKLPRLEGGGGDVAGNSSGRGIAHRGATERTNIEHAAATIVGIKEYDLFRHVMTFL